jgi:hypothetical protein
MKITLTIFLALLLGGGGTYAWLYYGGFEGEKHVAIAFIDAYGDYREIAEQVEVLTHVPGTGNNRSRSELFDLLKRMLTEQIEPEKRDELARIAFGNLDALKKEVEAAHSAQAQLYGALQDLDNMSRTFESVRLRTDAEEIVAMARKRAELTARTTAILSETNDQTYSIITRILADKGELTDAHIHEINEATARAEERFATLKEQYTALALQSKELQEAFQAFVQTAI